MQDYPSAMLHHKLLVSAVNGQWGGAYNKPYWLGHVPTIDFFFLGCESRSCSHLSYLQFISMKNKHQIVVWCVDGAGATDATAKNPKHHQQSQGATAKDGGRWWEAFMDSAGMVSLSVSEGILAQHRLNLWGPRKRMLTAGSPRKGLLVLRCRRDRTRTHTGPWKKYACRRFWLIGIYSPVYIHTIIHVYLQMVLCLCLLRPVPQPPNLEGLQKL